MKNPERHGTEKKRQFGSSEKIAAHTLAWLNDDAKDTARERIRRLFRDVRIISSDWKPEIDPDDGEEIAAFRGDKKAYAKAAYRIAITLQKYKFWPGIMFFGGLITQWTPHSGPDGRYRRRWPPLAGAYDDCQAVLNFFAWNNGRDAHRIRECNCGKWFYAKFDHQNYCSSKCREKAFRSTPMWKEYRRQKAREYYWLHKNKNVK
jgi:hypothetical protein